LTEMYLSCDILLTTVTARLLHISKTLKMREKIENGLLQFVTSRDVICKFCVQRKSQFFNRLVIVTFPLSVRIALLNPFVKICIMYLF